MRKTGLVTVLCLFSVGVARAEDTAAAAAGSVISVKVVQGAAQPGGTVTVEAFVSGVVNLNAYQVQLGVTGGEKGTLTLESMNIDRERQDFVHYQATSELIDVVSKDQEWIGLVRVNGTANAAQSAYLATFVLRASADAAGTFQINVRGDGSETFMLDSQGAAIPHTAGKATAVRVGAPAPTRTEDRKKG